jgi:hypothetical protein
MSPTGSIAKYKLWSGLLIWLLLLISIWIGNVLLKKVLVLFLWLLYEILIL